MTNVPPVMDDPKKAVEKAISDLSNLPDRNYAPPRDRGVIDTIREIKDFVAKIQERIDVVESKLAALNDAHGRFYNGRK
jgi:hypothetical protein